MRIFLLTCLLSAGTVAAFGQSKDSETAFPTYQQIRQSPTEIIDVLVKPGQPLIQNQPMQYQPMRIPLFDYPPGSVTYILNGKSTTNTIKAKKQVSKPENQVENIHIGPPDASGKRTITIDFLPKNPIINPSPLGRGLKNSLSEVRQRPTVSLTGRDL